MYHASDFGFSIDGQLPGNAAAIPQGKRYRGESGDIARAGTVYVENRDGSSRLLNPRHDLRNHSPDGFAWGYHGSGPAQLALAILADAANDSIAQRYYQDYKTDVVSALREQSWTIHQADVLSWIRKRQEAEAA